MSLNIDGVLASTKDTGKAPWAILGAVAAVVIAGTLLLRTDDLSTGLVITFGVLAVIAGLVALSRHLEQRREIRLQLVARRLMDHEAGVGLVVDHRGCIVFANAAAEQRFGAVGGARLTQVFATMLANPDGVLRQIGQQAAKTGSATEDIVTRGGHFRLRLLSMSAGCRMWWLDELGDTGIGKVAPRSQQGLAMLTADAGGRITYCNDAFRSLIGGTATTLSKVFKDLPLKPGQVHRLSGAEKTPTALVAVIENGGGARDIYLMPDAPAPVTPPQIEAGWNAIEDLPVPLLRVARDGALLGSNREARKLLSISTSDGTRLADVLDGPGRPINAWIAEALAGQTDHVSQFLHGRGEKQDTFVQVTLNSAGTKDDPHLIAVLNDVTELRTLEAQFVQSQKMQAIGQLAGGIAHDFNNLLTAIAGHCELLLCHHDEHDRDYGDLTQIHQNTNRAASLVGQLLAFSRKQNLQLERIDLRDTLSDLTHLLNRLVGGKVSLTLDHDSNLLEIQADKRQLEQVLMNLVVNARDAMQGAGEIRIATQNLKLQQPMQRDRATVPVGEYVVVKVSDDGSGIAPEKRDKIFEPFFTTKRTGEGTGLGLSTAYGIMKQTGGFIFVDSAINRGTTFTLLFPSAKAEKTQARPSSPVMTEELTSYADGIVLLVEDEAPVRAFASRALRLRGYTVLEADCGEAALDLLGDKDLHVDVFVTDVIMPGEDGPTWVRKALIDRPDARVVFVSGYPEDAFDEGQPQVTGAAFLPKPFSLNDLAETVQKQMLVGQDVVEPKARPAPSSC